MKKRHCAMYSLLGMLAITILVSSCSVSSDSSDSSDSSASAFTAEFTGCDFSRATVARVEMFESGVLVAYGNGVLQNGEASFSMINANTGNLWLPTLNIRYTAYAYCFPGSVEDPVPSNDYWKTVEIAYTQYEDSAYAELGIVNSYFVYIP